LSPPRTISVVVFYQYKRLF